MILLWLPVAPVVLATSIDALIPGWDDPRERAWLGVSAAGAAFGGLVTADVVRGINHELLFAAQPPENRGNLSVLRTHRVCWVAGNYFRVALHLDRHSVIKSCHMQKECRDLF